MDKLNNELKKRIEELERLRAVIAKEYSQLKAKTGILNTSKSHNSIQYYVKKNGKREYIKKKNISEAIKLAQRDYDEAALQVLAKSINEAQKLFQNINCNPLLKAYDPLVEGRKKLVNKHFVTDAEYIEKWLSYEYVGKGFREGADVIMTERGERVRSKSEKIIADKLFTMGIPYRYECPVFLKGVGEVFTDFTLLDVKNREEVYLEHFGMMDREDYARKAISKIKSYESNGIFQGDKILYTFETSVKSINMANFERMIRNRFGSVSTREP